MNEVRLHPIILLPEFDTTSGTTLLAKYASSESGYTKTLHLSDFNGDSVIKEKIERWDRESE